MKNKLMEEDESVYKNFLDVFGEDIQYTFLFEEMGELAQAVGKYLRKRTNATEEERKELISHISEEIADVKLCIEEIEYILDCWEDVKKWKNFKVNRGKERVKHSNLEIQLDKKNYDKPQTLKNKLKTPKSKK